MLLKEEEKETEKEKKKGSQKFKKNYRYKIYKKYQKPKIREENRTGGTWRASAVSLG